MEQWIFWPLFIFLSICYSFRLIGVSVTGLFTLNHPSYRHRKSVAIFAYSFIAIQLSCSICACLILLSTPFSKNWLLYSFTVLPLILPEAYYYGMTKLCANRLGKSTGENKTLNTQQLR